MYEAVPISQVPPGYVRVHIRDRGEFHIDAAAPSPTPEYQHPPFAPDVCAELEKQHETLARAGWEKTLGEWFDGFRYDRTPWREMGYWEGVVAAVDRFTAHPPGDDASASERRDVLGLVSTVAGDPSRVESHARSGSAFGPVARSTGGPSRCRTSRDEHPGVSTVSPVGRPAAVMFTPPECQPCPAYRSL